MPKCFKCEKKIKSATTSQKEAWQMPDGVLFEGGHNYGSSLYDSVDGIYVLLIVCDECLSKNKHLIKEKSR